MCVYIHIIYYTLYILNEGYTPYIVYIRYMHMHIYIYSIYPAFLVKARPPSRASRGASESTCAFCFLFLFEGFFPTGFRVFVEEAFGPYLFYWHDVQTLARH